MAIGTLKVVTGADPALGAEASLTVPAGKVWIPMSFRVPLDVSATVGTRQVVLTFSDGTTVFARCPAATSLTANQDSDLNWVHASSSGGFTGVGAALTAVLPRTILKAGFVVATLTTALQVDDNYGVPIMYVAEYTSVFEAMKDFVS